MPSSLESGQFRISLRSQSLKTRALGVGLTVCLTIWVSPEPQGKACESNPCLFCVPAGSLHLGNIQSPHAHGAYQQREQDAA